MCDTCGCAIPDHVHQTTNEQNVRTVEVLEGLKAHNDQTAGHNRHHFESAGVLVINLMSSPGAGKTSLLEATIDALKSRYRIAVIEGDLETENDADRIRAKGVQAIQISTGNACHLDADMVHRAVHALPVRDLDILFIENVGNLVCPASFDLGQHANVTLISTPEGDDKPLKYPVMFRASDLVLITKTDLLAVLDDFSCSAIAEHIQQLANPAPVMEISSRQGMITPWLAWLEDRLEKKRSLHFTPLNPTVAAAGRMRPPVHA